MYIMTIDYVRVLLSKCALPFQLDKVLIDNNFFQ